MAQIPLRKGMWLRHSGRVYVVTDFHERHTGKQKPTVHVALRDLRSGNPVDRTLDDLLPIEPVDHSFRQMQYLYAKGDVFVFMDCETFEEHELPAASLQGREAFLVAGAEYRFTFLEDHPISLEMPDVVPIKVAITADPGHSVGAAANITKEATLENDLVVRVPLFIKTGDVIRVDTRTKTYAGKEHAS